MKLNYTNKLCSMVLTLGFCTFSFGQIIENGTYQIFNAVHSEVMTTDTTAPYEAKMGAQDATDGFQLWTFTHQGNDVYKIENTGSNTFMGVNDGWCGQFGDVRAGFLENDTNVEFKVVASELPDSYVLQIAFTTCNFGSVNDPIKAFDIQDGNAGAQIQTFDVSTTNPNQQFRIVVPGSLSNNSFEAGAPNVFYNVNNRSATISAQETITSVDVIDLSGRVINTVKSADMREMQIQFNSDLNGLYLLKINTTEKSFVNKIMVY
ncbi:MAG: T9SS type A sorting domain-containing protein [Flavobacterium sp.]